MTKIEATVSGTTRFDTIVMTIAVAVPSGRSAVRAAGAPPKELAAQVDAAAG